MNVNLAIDVNDAYDGNIAAKYVGAISQYNILGGGRLPIFKIHLREDFFVDPGDDGMDFRNLHQAYLETCRAIPDIARDMLIDGGDPMVCTYVICDQKGRQLMEVPFVDVLSPSEWRMSRATWKIDRGSRSAPVRDRLALSRFRQIFASVNVGCVLLTPELQVKEINDFGARHSHVDPDEIRDSSILDAYDLSGEPKENFKKFWSLAQTGVVSELIDMPYLVLDKSGKTVDGWWNSKVWPIFDDDNRLLGLVDWAEPFTSPTAGGITEVRVAHGFVF